MIEIWFFLVIASVISSAVGEISQKFSVSTEDNISAVTINFYVAIIQAVLATLFLVVTNTEFDSSLSPKEFLFLTLGAFLSFYFFKFLYTSYKGNSASISQVIFSLSAFLSTFLGILFSRKALRF